MKLRSLRKSLLLAALVGAPISVAQAQSLATTAPNNGSGGVFMDLTPTTAELLVTSFESYFSSTAGGASTLEVYTRPGSYVGFESSSAGWTLVDTVSATSAGTTTLAPITLNAPIPLAANATTAIYIQPVSGQNLRYTGTSGTPPQTTWNNSDLTLFSDVARTGSTPFGGTLNTPRTFAGVVNYIPADPTPGACCLDDGTCVSVSFADCLSQGGVFKGANEPCATANCPQPAACCFPDGSCSVLLETDCTDAGGVFNSAAPTCATANCPQPPTGACCLPDGSCSVIWEPGCLASGGIYAGNGTDCTNPTCLNLVVPNANAAEEGNSSNSIPFTSTATYYRYQQVNAASEFGGVTGPVQITGMRFRPNATSTAEPWTTDFTLNLTLTTTTAAPDALSATFADNLGGDAKVVYSGPITLSTQQTTPVAQPPAAFDVVIEFQMPFTYDPTQGNLLFDVTREGTTIPANRFLDAVSPSGDPVSRVSSSTVGATSGTLSSIGLVVQFTYETDPTPPACYANCDGSTGSPVLNTADFGCFLTKFAAGDPYANCDGSTGNPTLNVADFGCFLSKFAAGCN